MKIENKCYGCTRRFAGCHATCEDYRVYVEANERRKAARESELDKTRYAFGTMFKKSVRERIWGKNTIPERIRKEEE